MESVYVYYRVDPAHANSAASRIDTLMDLMAIHCSQPPRRLTRCNDATMWMEIYEGMADPAAFLEAMQGEVARLRCDDFISGERHLECFVAS